MAAVKYSTTNLPNTIRVNNVALGINDVNYGPTEITGFYNTIDVPENGYCIYRFPNGEGSPNTYVAQNDADLIVLAGTKNVSTVSEAITFINGLPNTLLLNRNYENIVTDGLVLNLDASMLASYPKTGTTWNDISGNEKNGTLTNGPTFNGDNGGSIVFDGSNDYIEISPNGTTSGFNVQSFTIDMWVKVMNVGAYNVLWSYDFTSHTPPYYSQHIRTNNTIGQSTTNLTFTININGTSFQTVGTIVINFNQWVNVTFTRNSSTNVNTSYLNGVLKQQTTVASTISYYNQEVWIGRGNFGGYTTGNISVCKFYNRSLSSLEVLQNYNATKGRFEPPLDSDAVAFLTATQITDNTIKQAINTFVTSLKTNNIWTKFKAIYPFVGGTSETHKYNLKDPRDANNAFRITFYGGWTHSSTGALPNGFNTYADTYLVPSTDLPLNSTHFSYYSRTNASTQSAELGMQNSFGRIITNISWSNGISYTDQYNSSSNRISQSQANSLGLYSSNRVNTNTLKYFKNGVQMSTTNTNTASPNSSNLNISIFIGNFNNFGSPGNDYSTKQVSFFAMGEGLTDSEISNLYTSVQALQTTLNRQV